MPRLSLDLTHGSAAEAAVGAALERLVADYDLEDFLYTTDIVIDHDGFPHSHPRLTLSADKAEAPNQLLAEFLHEQLHWFEEEEAERRDVAIADSARLYPAVPAERPEGAGSETSTRLHLLVCYWEYQALKRYLGDVAARGVIEDLSRHHYTWVYRRVLDDEARIGRFIAGHGLAPRGLGGSRRGGRTGAG